MSDQDQMAVLDEMLPSTQQVDEKALMAGTDFLSRLSLVTFNSDVVKEDKIKAGHWAVIGTGSEIEEDLGPEAVVVLVDFRPKAADLSNKAEPVISFDMQSDFFQKIKKICDDKSIPSEDKQGLMYGPEYLVFIPELNRFVTFHCGSISLRISSRAIHGLFTRRVPVLAKNKVTKGKKGSWHVPIVMQYTGEFQMCLKDDLNEAVAKFREEAAKNVNPEEAPEEASSRDR